jgi:hypothetical protein
MSNDNPIPEFVNILMHMLGAQGKQPGYRNRYVVVLGGEAHALLLDMEDAGLVEAGLRINGGKDQYFFANRAGCEYIGLSQAATARALKD